MKVTVTAEYQLDGPAEVVEFEGESALQLGEKILKPFIAFSRLSTVDQRRGRLPPFDESDLHLWEGWVMERRSIVIT